MTRSKWLVAVIVALVAVGAIFLVLPKDKNKGTTAQNTTPASSVTSDTSTDNSNAQEQTFTAADVADHNTEGDCWTIIEGEVYDITKYVSRHPGGDEILRACGQDATTLFTTRHTEDGQAVGSGTPHSSSAENTLEQFHIGTLAN